ncbi:hypothetical protein B0H19DRAFT_1163682 [Mycena capillaripes]|nr:hypothetical protein B0H19DRAFT_1163682 [Mycena capillaripes]
MATDYEAQLLRAFDIAKGVFKTVNSEYYAWKEKHLGEVWDRLIVGSDPSSSVTSGRFSMPRALFEEDPEVGDTDCIYVWDYDSNGNPGPGKAMPVIEGQAAERFFPHLPYQYCTPASRSYTASMIDNKSSPFLPFPEDPTFPREEYLECFESFQWIDDRRDPDEEVVQYETVRRLHVDHRLSAEIINDILREYTSFRPLRLSSESGLLWDVSQRDLPPVIWGDGLPSSSKRQLPPDFGRDPADNLFQQINNGLANFCPHLNCIIYNCHVHVDPQWNNLTPPVAPKEPRLTNDGLRALARLGAACGDECFLLCDDDDMDVDTDDVPLGDLTVLFSMLKLEPDMLPCHLAVICRIACQRVFLHRKQTIDDGEVIPPGKRRRKSKPLTNKKKEKLDFSGETAPPSPCVHPGPCSGNQFCECFVRKKYCERNCRCADSCVRRWPGCNSTCARNPRCKDSATRRKRCKCRAAQRECDPEKCTVCDARNTHTHFPEALPVARTNDGCTNVTLQRGTFKHFEIRRSMYGLGAFAAEEMQADDMLGEYVGELLDDTEETLQHRGIIQKHSKLNYCFGMEGQKETMVDAQWLGNPTRFLNHAEPANCFAQELIVNGERRIVIRAGECSDKKKHRYILC